MDEISVLRRLRSDVEDRAPGDVARGRAALFELIEADSPLALFGPLGEDTAFDVKLVRRRRRLVVRWAGFSTIAATTLVVGLVAVNLLGVGVWRGGADPAAASALRSAAAATLTFSDPVASPGQYVLVRTDAVYFVAGANEEDVQRAAPGAEGFISPEDETGFLEDARTELYIPADRSDDWVEIRCMRKTHQTFGPKSEKLAAQTSRDNEKYVPDRLLLLPGGAYSEGSSLTGYWDGQTTYDNLDALPRDPDALLAKIYSLTAGAGPSRDGEALVWIADTLRQGTVPADFRAALYEAAIGIPDVTVVDEQATLNGTTGIAIGRYESNGNFRQDIIIDATTGQFIGERQIPRDGLLDAPSGTAQSSTAVATTVVDIAPTDTATCAAQE